MFARWVRRERWVLEFGRAARTEMPLLNDLPCKVFDESTNVEDSQDVQPTQSASRSLESSLSFSVVLDVANL